MTIALMVLFVAIAIGAGAKVIREAAKESLTPLLLWIGIYGAACIAFVVMFFVLIYSVFGNTK